MLLTKQTKLIHILFFNGNIGYNNNKAVQDIMLKNSNFLSES